MTGYALDNFGALSSLQVRLGDGAWQDISVDTKGHFAFSVDDVFGNLANGSYAVGLRATDAAGNTSAEKSFAFIADSLAPSITLSSLADGDVLSASSRLVGTVSGTGSAITAFSYQLDGGAIRPVSIDATTGTFDAALDLKALALGSHSMTLRATDAAGLTTETSLSLSLPQALPFAIERSFPANGEDEIGVTFRPKVVFTRPVDTATLTEDSFYATDPAGERLPAKIVVSSDATQAWLFFENAMPGARV
ncbi:Ig-like domain-containing protein [Azotobacter sp. CWF10]